MDNMDKAIFILWNMTLAYLHYARPTDLDYFLHQYLERAAFFSHQIMLSTCLHITRALYIALMEATTPKLLPSFNGSKDKVGV